MAISGQTNSRTFVAQGGGATVSINFPFANPADLVVTRIETDGSESAPLTLNSHYAISGSGRPQPPAGTLTGVLTEINLVAGRTHRIVRRTGLLQKYEPRNAVAGNAGAMENQLDDIVMAQQDVRANTAEVAHRALLVPFGEEGPEVGSLAGANGMALGIVDDKVVPIPNDVAGSEQIKADVEALKEEVAADKDDVAADREAVADDKALVAADRAAVSADRAATQGFRNDAQTARNEAAGYASLAQQWVNADWYASWAALSGASGTADDRAIVHEDAGTHTDPVTSATVDNAGLYLYTTGWQWIAGTESLKAKAWAEGSEPGGPGTYSAKEQAERAEAAASAYLPNAGQLYERFPDLDAFSIEASNAASLTPFTATENVAGGFDVEVTNGSRYYMVGSPYAAFADRSVRWTVSATITRIDSGTWGIGIAVGSGASRRAYQYRFNSQLVHLPTDNDTDVTVLGTSASYAQSANVAMSLIRHPDGSGEIIALISGEVVGRAAIPSGIPLGPVWITHRGDGAAYYASLFQETMNSYIAGEIAVAATPELTAPDRTTLFAMSEMLRPLRVSLPDWWTWALDFNIYGRGDGSYFTDLDYQQRRPFADSAASATLYVDVATGSDSNPGTQVAPLKSIYAAVHGRSGNVRALIKPGLYAGQDGWRDGNPASTNLIIEPWPGATGRIVSSRHLIGLSWALTSGRTNTYEATITTVSSVFDASRTDASGDYEPLMPVASIDTVEATPNSYYVNGTTVYVHRQSGAAPGSAIRVYPDIRNARFHVSGGTVWIRGVDFEGGRHPFHLAEAGELPSSNQGWFWDCSFKYGSGSSGQNGLSTTGECYSYCKSCIAAKNRFDGFNYHGILTVSGAKPHAIEIDCIGRGNGWDAAGADTHNGSTMHDGGDVLRVGGDYRGNKNRNVHDINGSPSLNYGCIAGDSFGVNSRVSFASGIGSGDATVMGLVDCVSSGGISYDLETAVDSVIKLARFAPESPSSVPGSNVEGYP